MFPFWLCENSFETIAPCIPLQSTSFTMKFVALVSGGKDSTFAIAEAMKQGHELVAIAHLASFDLSNQLVTDSSSATRFSVLGVSVEQDSWMYQSVGSELVPLLAIAYDKPLYWVDPASSDEFREEEDTYLKSFGANAFVDSAGRVDRDVVRLWRLLRFVKEKSPDSPPQALVSGAILSNYQRTRIEVVCRALGWVSISPLWQKGQSQLLSAMGLSAGIDARLIKSASIGLDASHLMQSLCPSSAPQASQSDEQSAAKESSQGPASATSTLGSELKKLASKYGVNECGEGGEYESFSMDANIFPHFRILPLTWNLVKHDSDSASGQDASLSPVSHVRFHHVALVEKHENAFSAVSETYGSAAASLAAITIPFSQSSHFLLGEAPDTRSEKDMEEIEKLISSTGTLTALLKTLVETGKLVIVTGLTQHNVPLPVLGIDAAKPNARNPLVDTVDPSIDALRVTGPHYTTAGAIMGSKLGLTPTDGKNWKKTNFYVEASHNVFEDVRSLPASIDGSSVLAKDISQATQAVMNAIARKLAENGLSFRNVYFASLTIPSMSFFGDMNPVYSSYFVPVFNPPSRVTVAQKPRHPSAASNADSSASNTVDPSIRIEFWGLIPDCIDASLKKSLAIPETAFSAHNVLHVESYSAWAPACIGPYSQAHEVLGVDHLAGQIALIPSEMVLFAASPCEGDAEKHMYERTLGELRWALKHVVSLVNARRTKAGVQVQSSQELLFASMFTSVPISLTNRCIDYLQAEGTEEEKAALELVLKGATLLRVDQLPRLAAVEIQVMMDSPESPLHNTVDSNLIAHHSCSTIEKARKANVFETTRDEASAFTAYTRFNVSQSLAFAHSQHVIVGPKEQATNAAKIVDFVLKTLNAVAPSVGCVLDQSSPSTLLSTNLFYNTAETDNSEFVALAGKAFPYTPYPVLEVGAPHSWIPELGENEVVLAAVHSKWALALDLDD